MQVAEGCKEDLSSAGEWHHPSQQALFVCFCLSTDFAGQESPSLAHAPRHVHMYLAMFCFSLLTNCSKLRATRCMGGMQTSWSKVLLRKASCSMICKFWGRLSCSTCEQHAKVEPKSSMTHFWDKSTVCSCWQLMHAAVPILLKSDGRKSATMSASRKQQSGKFRFGFVGLHLD